MLNIWHLQNIDYLQALTAEDLEVIQSSSEPFNCATNDLVFEPSPNPHHVYVLETGLIKIYRESAQATEAVLGYVRPREVFGELTLFSSKPRESFARAVVASTGFKIPRDPFRDALRNSPAATFAIAMQIEGRFKEVEARVEDLVFRNVRSRLARILLQLSHSFGVREGAAATIERRFTHKDLAALTGASRPSISLAMGEFEDDGIISRTRGATIIEDLDRLQAIAEEVS